jgi:hypothetical protein
VSGTVTLQAPAVSGTTVLTLPTTNGTILTTATGQTLTSPTITGAVVSSMASSVITSGTAVASTSGTNIDFTSIPSWVKRLTIMLNGISLSGSAHLLIQIGTGGTPTTSGYNSASSYATINTSSSGGVTSTTGFIMYFASAAYVDSGHFTITNISGNIWICSGMVGNTTSIPYTGQTGGNVSLGGTLNMLRITTSNGTDTFDAGSVNILYE